MDSDLNLTALRAFRAVVKEGSFSAAAASLRTPKSTLSKRVADLEADLGVRLIERTTRQMRITAEGEVLAARADRLLGEAEDIRRALGEAGGDPRGHLRIAVPTLMGQMMIGRLAARFRTSWPEITLECHFLDRAPDLLEEGFDGALRFGPLEDSGQMARLLGHSRAIIVASPALGRSAGPASPADLPQYPLVGIAASWTGAWTFETAAGEHIEVQVKPPLVLGSYLAVRDALIEAPGVSVLPQLLARPEIEAGRLVHLLPGWSSPRKPLYFVYPSAQSVTARLRLLIDFLSASLFVEDCVARPDPDPQGP